MHNLCVCSFIGHSSIEIHARLVVLSLIIRLPTDKAFLFEMVLTFFVLVEQTAALKIEFVFAIPNWIGSMHASTGRMILFEIVVDFDPFGVRVNKIFFYFVPHPVIIEIFCTIIDSTISIIFCDVVSHSTLEVIVSTVKLD